jgi:diaminohydroxyphosphoribosylaminopyrimidine deaminase/5-amino-6-(5-phosphoribosylamino)uracil reductase
MVGAGTVIKDNPQLTARTEGLDDPVRIIVDGNLSVPLKAKVFQKPGETIVLTTTAADEKKREELSSMGVDIIMTDSGEKGKVDLPSAMTGLALKGIDGILLEGGATLAASAFEAEIVDKVRIYQAPMIIGGTKAPGLIGGAGAPSIAKAIRMKNISTEMSGPDLVIEAYVDREDAKTPDRRIDELEEELKAKDETAAAEGPSEHKEQEG